MPGQRHRAKLDEIIIAIMALLLIAGLIALGFLQNISSENRALLVMALSLGIIGCFAGLMSLGTLRRWLRKRVWQRAMGVWDESSQAKNLPKFVMMDNLSESALRQLAIRIYSRMGYRILNRLVFFVSIGMLVNPGYLPNNIGTILALTGLIVIRSYCWHRCRASYSPGLLEQAWF